MTHVIVETDDGDRYSVDVDKPDPIEKMHIAAEAPDELVEASEYVDDPDDFDGEEFDLSPDMIDYLVDVATRVTELDEADLQQVPTAERIDLCAEILNTVFEEDGDTGNNKRRVKRVRLTDDFITHLFRGEVTMVAGMPDDATFEEFNYDPSRMELQFIFSSDEWDEVPEGAEIPTMQAGVVERSSSTKEL